MEPKIEPAECDFVNKDENPVSKRVFTSDVGDAAIGTFLLLLFVLLFPAGIMEYTVFVFNLIALPFSVGLYFLLPFKRKYNKTLVFSVLHIICFYVILAVLSGLLFYYRDL